MLNNNNNNNNGPFEAPPSELEEASSSSSSSLSGAQIAFSVLLFVAAGVCEIGGGWLVWKWRRDGWHFLFFVLGSAVLVAYGIIPTLQHADFGRTYAAYGGFFIVLSLLWGWALDGDRPDRWDVIGASVALVGVSIIIFTPRK